MICKGTPFNITDFDQNVSVAGLVGYDLQVVYDENNDHFQIQAISNYSLDGNAVSLDQSNTNDLTLKASKCASIEMEI